MLANKKLLNIVLATMLVGVMLGGTTSAFSQSLLVAGFVSDDFNPCGPLGVWTPVTTTGQTVSNDGNNLLISVSDNTTQTIWANGTGPVQYNVARVMQPFGGAGLTDPFEIEVKFDSKVTSEYQQQGIVVEQDAGNVLRFELFHDNTDGTVLYYGRFLTEGGVGVKKGEGRLVIGDTSAATSLFLKVSRAAGDLWTLSFRTDATDYTSTTPLTFTQTNFNVTQVGVYAGSTPRGANVAPAHTAIVDYFFNTASPISPEDAGANTLTVTPSGTGTVDVNPVQPAGGYTCGAVVELTANPGAGWAFVRWEGDLTGNQNPASVTMDGAAKSITAVFQQEGAVLDNLLFLPAMLR